MFFFHFHAHPHPNRSPVVPRKRSDWEIWGLHNTQARSRPWKESNCRADFSKPGDQPHRWESTRNGGSIIDKSLISMVHFPANHVWWHRRVTIDKYSTINANIMQQSTDRYWTQFLSFEMVLELHHPSNPSFGRRACRLNCTSSTISLLAAWDLDTASHGQMVHIWLTYGDYVCECMVNIWFIYG